MRRNRVIQKALFSKRGRSIAGASKRIHPRKGPFLEKLSSPRANGTGTRKSYRVRKEVWELVSVVAR